MSYPYPPAHDLRTVRRLGRLLIALTFLLVIVLVLYAWPLIRGYFSPHSTSRAVTPRGNLADFETTTINTFREASPCVAFITTDIRRTVNRRIEDVPAGAGSGFIWDTDNASGYYVVTNFHVIQHASAAHVILNDQTSYDAAVIGADPDHDLAVLRITPGLATRLPLIPVGTSADLKVGQYVLAIGNPFGLDQTLTTGVISALNRTINGVNNNPIDGLIQTDAAINPGNSGGPLLDSAGRLIGMNTAIYSPSGTWSGIGFAIPVDTINRIVPQITRTGHATRAKLGIEYDDALSQQLLGPRRIIGLAISDVEPNSPAAKAGLQGLTQTRPARGPGGRGGALAAYTLGDVLTHFNDRPIKSGGDLFTAIDRINPGDSVDLTILRNGQPIHVQLKAQ